METIEKRIERMSEIEMKLVIQTIYNTCQRRDDSSKIEHNYAKGLFDGGNTVKKYMAEFIMEEHKL
jgi:hypothetical protein